MSRSPEELQQRSFNGVFIVKLALPKDESSPTLRLKLA